MEIIRNNCNTITILNVTHIEVVVNIYQFTLDTIFDTTTLIPTEGFLPQVHILQDEDYTVTLPSDYIYIIQLDGATTVYYTMGMFCDLIDCRKQQLLRILGEPNNCKEECDCMAVYDFNAFSVLYEMIITVIEELDEHINTTPSFTLEEIKQITTLQQLIEQAKKYCKDCNKPCKDC